MRKPSVSDSLFSAARALRAAQPRAGRSPCGPHSSVRGHPQRTTQTLKAHEGGHRSEKRRFYTGRGIPADTL